MDLELGVVQTARSLSQRKEVRELCKRASDAQAFESLVEVTGVGQTGLRSRTLFVSAINADRIWDAS